MSASTVSPLKRLWAQEYWSWYEDCLDKDRWVYVWVAGVYSGPGAEQTKLCTLVVIGVNERGEKHFLAIEDGVCESIQSWREVLLKLKSRGMNTPELAIGDGAISFWVALEGGLPPKPSAARLDAQEHERAQLPAELSSGEGQAGTA
jgi:putative transposase